MVNKLRRMLEKHNVAPAVIAEVMKGSEPLTNRRGPRTDRQAFLIRAMSAMDELLDFRTRCEVRNDCACSTGGWREQEARRIAREFAGKGIAERLKALGQVRFMGSPALQADGTVLAGVGAAGGFPCPCPEFAGWQNAEPVSPTYCLCCAGHFRHHYQIALGVKLKTRAVLSSILESQGARPCRFIFEIVEAPPRSRRQIPSTAKRPHATPRSAQHK